MGGRGGDEEYLSFIIFYFICTCQEVLSIQTACEEGGLMEELKGVFPSEEMFAQFNDIFIKVCVVCADTSNSQELTIRDAVLASLWVC